MTALGSARSRACLIEVLCAFALLETSCTVPVIGSDIDHVASWGIVVIASHSSSAGSGEYHRQGIDWLLAQNEDPSSPLLGRLSARAGVAGHSQGGLGASAAVTHPNVEAEVCVQGGGSPADRAALLLTGTDDFMSTMIHSSYSMAEGPAFLASYEGADHISTPTVMGAATPGGIEYKRLYAAWMRCWLADDESACALFDGGQSCGICSDPGWAELESKNF